MANVDKVVTNVNLIEGTGVAVPVTAFTSDTSVNDTETLIITPTRPGCKLVLIINENGSGDQGAMSVTITAGDYWAGVAMAAVTIANTIKKAFVFEPAKYQAMADSHIHVKVAPYTGKKLATNHAATWQCFQMPGPTAWAAAG